LKNKILNSELKYLTSFWYYFDIIKTSSSMKYGVILTSYWHDVKGNKYCKCFFSLYY